LEDEEDAKPKAKDTGIDKLVKETKPKAAATKASKPKEKAEKKTKAK